MDEPTDARRRWAMEVLGRVATMYSTGFTVVIPLKNNSWNLKILLMEEILHQLIGIVYPIIYQVLYIPGGEKQYPPEV